MYFSKRLFDLLVTALGLVIILPLMLLLSLLVWIFLGIPILFRQPRPGYKGRPFITYKFRTMTDVCDSSGRLLPDERRLTALGRFLRRTSLDELPQLWNVLKGDMSLVGPRPIRPRFFEELAEDIPSYWQRLVVRPGLTGFAQVRKGYETSWAEKLAHDLEYIADRSVRLYLRTLVATGWRVLRQSLRGLVRPRK